MTERKTQIQEQILHVNIQIVKCVFTWGGGAQNQVRAIGSCNRCDSISQQLTLKQALVFFIQSFNEDKSSKIQMPDSC